MTPYARYGRAAVLGSETLAGTDAACAPDILVDAAARQGQRGTTPNIQMAVDLAIRAAMSGDARPRHIRIAPGFYQGPVHIPATAPPLRLIGAGPDQCSLVAGIDAGMPGDVYAARFGSVFEASPPSVMMRFSQIAAREKVATGNCAVLTIARDDVSVSGLTIRNDYACDRAAMAPARAEPDVEGRFAEGQHQAVALHVAGADQVCLSDLVMTSFQDTLYLQAAADRVNRIQITDSVIEGDVDFIFGGATAHFEASEIRARGARGASSWSVAPSTSIERPFGFVFDRCRFTHDGSERGKHGGYRLGRQWFEGVRATPYGPRLQSDPGDHNTASPHPGRISRKTLEAVGKCTIVNSEIGSHIDPAQPWDDWGMAGGQRFRPVQISAGAFLMYLGPWLEHHGLDYSHLDPAELWLQIIESRWLA